jgi:putative transposase
VVTEVAHHITQRGNNRQDVFFVDDDRRVYLELLQKYCEKYGMRVHGYCLMTNHVHLVAIPEKEESLAKAIGRTHFCYSQYINRFHNRSGHLWQGRFYSCALDERHFWLAMRYVELNPVRAKICRKPWRYEWSSAAAHIDGDTESELKAYWPPRTTTTNRQTKEKEKNREKTLR